MVALKVGVENAKVASYGLMDVGQSKEIERKVKDILEACRSLRNFALNPRVSTVASVSIVRAVWITALRRLFP